MNFVIIILIISISNLSQITPSFAMKDGDDKQDVSIPLIDNPEPSSSTNPVFKSISYISDVVTVKNVNGKLEFEVGDLLLCEKNSDSNIIACRKTLDDEFFSVSTHRDNNMRGADVRFDPLSNTETEIKRIISSELGETEPKTLLVSKKIPRSYTQHIKHLLDKVSPIVAEDSISASNITNASNETLQSNQSYAHILPLSIYLPAISDQYADTSIMYVNVTTPTLIQIYLDSFYNMECSWYIHSILQQDIQDSRMIDVTWGAPYAGRIKKNIVVSEPTVSLYKRPKSSFWRWFKTEISTVIISSNIHIMKSGKFIVTYNHRCNTFAKPSNVVRTINIEAFDVPTSESGSSCAS